MAVQLKRAGVQALQYWRSADLPGTTLLHARYGRFEWERHVHDELVIVVPERGVGEVRSRSGAERGGSGSIMIFAPGEYHCGRVEDADGWDYRAAYVDLPDLRRIGTFFEPQSRTGMTIPAGLYRDETLAATLLAVHRGTQEQCTLIETQTAWAQALFELFSRYGRPKLASSERALGRAALEVARDYIVENFRENISIDDLARRCGVSRYHLMHAFRERFGIPPHAFLNQVRLQAARRLLLTGSSVGAAALDSGFYDQSRFNRFFRRAYGISPARYVNPGTSA